MGSEMCIRDRYECVKCLQDTEKVGGQGEQESHMTKEHFDDLSDGATLFTECQGGATHPPGPIRTRQAQAPTGVQHIAHNGPRGDRIGFHPMAELKEIENPCQGQDIRRTVTFVPTQSVGVIDVRQEGRA